MSAFDSTLRVLDQIPFLTEEDPSGNDRPTSAQMVLQNIALIPTGPGQAMPLPIGVYRVPLTKSALRGLIKAAQEAEAELHEPSDFAIASDLRSVEDFARQQEAVTKSARR